MPAATVIIVFGSWILLLVLMIWTGRGSEDDEDAS